MSFNDWLSRRRLYTPERVAVVDDENGGRYSYCELDSRASRLAALLRDEYQVERGDRVACLATNCLEYIDLYFACGKVGAILVPLNFRLPSAGIMELLEDCRPALFFYETAFSGAADAAAKAAVVARLAPLDANQWLRGDQQAVEAIEADENEVAMILYTSGTTGRAKGAMITWRQIHWNALNTTIGLQLTENDAALLNMPLYHTGGWHVLFTPLMLLGGRVILQKGFDAARCNERVGPAGVTILFGVPTMLRMMSEAENFAAADLSRVRFAICGGEPCPVPLIETYRQRGVAIRQGYGLTEAGPNCFSLPAADAIRKQGSIGFPNFFIQARLVGQCGAEVPVGEVGELQMKGPHVFGGYWNNEAETNATLRDDWLSTGDLMMRDAEGYYFVVGRKKDMYISGGENVYPAQVERVLQSHDSVALAAVVAVPHSKWGETGCAFIQLHDGRTLLEGELRDWCRRHLAAFQCPTRFVLLTELPMGHSGKIDKLALKNRVADADTTS